MAVVFTARATTGTTSNKEMHMLVLSRKLNEKIILGHWGVLTVTEIRGDKIRLSIVAPKEVSVHRQEVYEAIARENAACCQTPLSQWSLVEPPPLSRSGRAWHQDCGFGLILSRHREESIIISDHVVVTVVDIRGDKARIGIAAPLDVAVHRSEVYDAIHYGIEHGLEGN